MKWSMQILPSALGDLADLPGYAQRIIIDAVNQKLIDEPTAFSRNLKQLRSNPVAGYELRVQGRYCVLYNVDQAAQTATITVIGQKRGNALYVRGKEYNLHYEDNPTD